MSSRGVPGVLEDCSTAIMRAAGTEGLFRVAPNYTELQELVNRIESGTYRAGEAADADPHVACGVVSLFLRSLPDPALPACAYGAAISAAVLPDAGAAVCAMRSALSVVPPEHLWLLNWILGLLQYVTERCHQNKMTIDNIGVVFGASLLRAPSGAPLDNLSAQQAVARLLVEHLEELLEIAPPPAVSMSDLDELGLQVRDLYAAADLLAKHCNAIRLSGAPDKFAGCRPVSEPPNSSSASRQRGQGRPDDDDNDDNSDEPQLYVAYYDSQAQYQGELDLHQGDIVAVRREGRQQVGSDGWWEGETFDSARRRGFFPAAFVVRIPRKSVLPSLPLQARAAIIRKRLVL
eukprot:m51a1_g3268 putative n-chimaerin-like isoform x1 (348) ;mRNA; f:210606-211864